MELGTQIKKYRQELQISQEELADRVYVSRQTISNWENDKSYPDVHSLMLLSEIFHTSLDDLIKGDIDIMKESVRKDDIAKYKHHLRICVILVLVAGVVAIPLSRWIGYWSLVLLAIATAVALYYGFAMYKLEKNYNITTYKELLAFLEGRKIDDAEKAKSRAEARKRRIRSSVCGGIVSFVIGAGIASLMFMLMELLEKLTN